MPLRDLLIFGSKSNPFEHWPSAPKLKPLVSGRVREKGVDTLLSADGNADTNPATLIIAFGEMGEKSLQSLAEKISQDNKDKVRTLLIKETSSSIGQGGLPIRVLELQKSPSISVRVEAGQSARIETMALFQQAVNYRRYQEWLQESLLDLGSNIQVFFTGSLAEPTIGLLGETLQILWNFPRSMGRTSLFSRVVAFFSMQSSALNALSVEEVFAVCREIGRFTFPGYHKMKEEYDGNPAVYSALLDALFILEESASQETKGFEKDNAQLLAESLYILTHSSSPKIWENLKRHLSDSGQVRHDTHQTIVHSLGIATLYIPTHSVKQYVSARLAYAAVLGEQINQPEGLVGRKPIQPELPFSTVRRFLTNGPYVHPSFRWVLDANSSSYFAIVPDLGPEFITAFHGQISHALIQALNEAPADLPHIRLSLEALENHLKQCEDWFKSSKPVNINAPERFSFQYALSKWREGALALLNELRGWEQAFFPLQVDPVTWPTSSASNWRSSAKENTTLQLKKDITGILDSYRKSAEKALVAGFSDRTYRSVASDPTGGLSEMESYYADTVRPELSRFTDQTSPSFKRIRDQLEWWIRLVPNQLPQLYLVCWHPQSENTPEPNPQYCFKAEQAQAFADAVFHLALSQTSALESDLTGKWFGKRVRLFAEFLRHANEASLSYDPNVASENIAFRQSYLIAHDPTLSRELVPYVFPETPRKEINELDGGDPTRLTALSLRLNIPFNAVVALQNVKRQYADNAPEKMHLYTQERTASVYEKRFRKLERTRIVLSPDFVALLADQQLVTVFCQALFTGIIGSAYDESGRQQSWKVSALEDRFAELELAPAGGDGLLAAFRRFVLELPNEPDLNQNPHKNFHPGKRSQYLNALIEKIKENAVQSRAVRDGLKQEFEYWRTKGEQDDLARSFSIILQCELDEPVWRDW